ncbi:hypothetical protein [Streptomyces mirabilis]|uniref:hypothetical protein n=1 Tax=Streptomyces mirabilis TaxID=68239 RepID=UPI0034111EE9
MPTGNGGGDRDAHSERAHQRARNHRGFVRSPETARRDAEACELRSKGWTYRQIADHFGISSRTAWEAVQEALKAIVKEPAEAALQFELDRLDAELVRLGELEEAAREILDRHHVTVANNGQIVHHDGAPLLDDGPVLQAIDRLLKIEDQRRRNGESRRKLLGMDAPSRVSVEAEQLGREISRLLDTALGEDAGDDADA